MDKDTKPTAPGLDEYTRRALEQGVSRRGFFARTAAGAAGAGALGLTGLAAQAATAPAGNLGRSSDGHATLDFLPRPQPIAEKDIAETLSFDVVVVGAGAAGVPAALSAAENGASVVVLQKHPMAVSQGNTGGGVDLDKSDKAGVSALVSKLCTDNGHRGNPALVRQWAMNSGEAIRWMMDRAKRGGAQVADLGSGPQPNKKVNGYTVNYVTSYFGPKPYTTGDGMRDLSRVAEQAGVKFLYRAPAQQLVQDENGTVRGVIAKTRDGKYRRFLARKGVILATGDYQNNRAMCDYFVPDLKHLGRKQLDRNGDGIVMAYWAGGVIEPIGHTKVLHDFDAGPATMCDMPFLAVRRDGKRFANEEAEMCVLNNYLRSEQDAGSYFQIFDADYMTQAAKWPGRLVDPEALKNWMPEDPSPKKGVFPSQINTYAAASIRELAAKLKVDEAALVATVQRNNELAALGRDEDFGKSPAHLVPVLKAPFYGIHRRLRISAILSGILVNEDHQALTAEGRPIKGLYLIGNVAGGFYGGIDYPMTVHGLSLGRCYTSGYLAGRHVARL